VATGPSVASLALERKLAVEQSEAMLNHAQTLLGLTTHCADALSFAQDHAIRYEKVLMKEVVHHIPLADLPLSIVLFVSYVNLIVATYV
jgi:hypothetical protein